MALTATLPHHICGWQGPGKRKTSVRIREVWMGSGGKHLAATSLFSEHQEELGLVWAGALQQWAVATAGIHRLLPLTVWFGGHHLHSLGWSVPSLEWRSQGLFQTQCPWGEWVLGYVPSPPCPPSPTVCRSVLAEPMSPGLSARVSPLPLQSCLVHRSSLSPASWFRPQSQTQERSN